MEPESRAESAPFPGKFRKVERFVKKINLPEGSRVIDIGGTKFFYDWLNSLFPKCEVFCLNQNKGDLNGIENAILADAQNIPIKSATFDFVLSLDVSEHLVDPDALFEGAFSILRGGGYL